MSGSRRPSVVVIGLVLIVGVMLLLVSGAPGGLSRLWSNTPATPEADSVTYDPRNLPIGRYVFRTPNGVIAGRTPFGGVRTRILLFDDTVKWRERSDADGGLPEDRYSLQVLIDPITEHYGLAPRRPPNETAVVIQESLLAFLDSRLFLRLLWLKDAQGDYAELNCAGGPALYEALVESRSLAVLSQTNCRFKFKPHKDVTVMMQTIPGERIPDFLKHAQVIYDLVSNAIEIEP